MKSSTLFPALLMGSAVQGYLIPPKVNTTQLFDWKMEHKRQALGTLTWMIGKGGKVSDPAGAAKKKVVMESPSKVPGAKRIKMRHGPYSVPNMNKKGITGEAGSLWNYPDTDIEKPCTQCTIVAQQAGLEFPDGKNANIDSGLWLHHMVHFLSGPGRWDPTCLNSPSLPHFDVGQTPGSSERYFSSGNERTFFGMDHAGADTKFGYHIKTTDKMAFIVDLMNMNMDDKVVYMTMTYDFVDGPLPSGWREVKNVWFDVNECGTSEVNPLKQSGKYTITSKPWTPNFEGEILGVGGHLHDGGVDLQVQVAGQDNCVSKAGYGEKPEFIFKKMTMGAAAGMAEKHISSMSACYFNEQKVTQLLKSQSWQIKGNYDYDKFEGNKDDGKQSSVMGIALMYVAMKDTAKPGT
ncbi:hypothetical protein FKW77_003155 [Venturia effusa]|uniref:Diphthamide biosynthesis protein 2 n=1 Tax=Venturia effusa TaxID=50376 RepID=A0A517L8Y6_9PEZI|nr:hypothetical protein FKW77_003155 [Venturia effusa]